ncbi:MAG: hypothetical protein ACW97Z_03565 [Candidatus Hodarchaeales archaeon]|jgi:hypothetical protein
MYTGLIEFDEIREIAYSEHFFNKKCDYRGGFYPAIMDECNHSLVFTIAPTLAIVFLKKSDVKRNPILTKSNVTMVMAEPEIKKLNKDLRERANRYVFSHNKSIFLPLN